jgi:hypothetical protein
VTAVRIHGDEVTAHILAEGDTTTAGGVIIKPFRPTWWRCLLGGHIPGGERDWIGAPVKCVRCDAEDTEMALWQYQRFCGKTALADWAAASDRELAWDQYSTALVPDARTPLMRQLAMMTTDPAWSPESEAGIGCADSDPRAPQRSF